jgi:phosphohistidine swiveling domain-containing protein
MTSKLLEGEVVCGGVVTGTARVVTDPRDAVGVQPGEILVVPCSNPEYALGVMQAAGLICEYGGVISHICTVAIELGIPCVTEAKDATSVLSTSMRITLDADRGIVYAAA